MAQLDHIVLLLSTPDFESPPPWLSENFTIIDGGKHTGQASRNKLIFFKDGTYVELFNWYDDPPKVDDQKQPMRVWGQKHPGLIDFALTSPNSPEEYVEALNQRIDGNRLGVSYQQPVPGGRKRADGIDVKWKVTRPKFHTASHTPSHSLFPGGRLDAPFFCNDVTERNVRVLFDDEKVTSHACGAVGIAEVRILVPHDESHDYASLYKEICGAQDVSKGKDGRSSISIATPVASAKNSEIVIQTADDMSRLHERGIGISDIVVATGAENGSNAKDRQLGTRGIASTVWIR